MTRVILNRPAARHRFLPQGTIVHYTLPFASTLELVGRQVGIVLSRDIYNRVNDRPCICPILYGESRLNGAWGIRVPTDSELISYLRPDLSSFIAMDYGQVKAVRDRDGQPRQFPIELTRAAAAQFVATIDPPAGKRWQRRKNFLAYGEIGLAHDFPRLNCDKTDRVPFVNLTLPEQYEETGMAIVARAYSNIEKIDHRRDVGVRASHWFKEGFFSVNDIRALPTEGLLVQSNDRVPFTGDRRAVKGISKKVMGVFDDAAYAQIVERYTDPPGRMPAFIISTGRKPQQQYRR